MYVQDAPGWFWATSLGALTYAYARMYMTLLRPASVVPGYTAYTRLQCVWLFGLFLLLTAASVLLFAGQDQCNAAKALTAALLSSFLSGILTTIARLAFKYSNLRAEVPTLPTRAAPPKPSHRTGLCCPPFITCCVLASGAPRVQGAQEAAEPRGHRRRHRRARRRA